jgi:hypothetical protein
MRSTIVPFFWSAVVLPPNFYAAAYNNSRALVVTTRRRRRRPLFFSSLAVNWESCFATCMHHHHRNELCNGCRSSPLSSISSRSFHIGMAKEEENEYHYPIISMENLAKEMGHAEQRQATTVIDHHHHRRQHPHMASHSSKTAGFCFFS